MTNRLIILLLFSASAFAVSVVFDKDNFDGKLGGGWSWVREDPAAWRIRDKALEINIQPGNLWGDKNDAKNVLVRPLPKVENGASLSARVTVENKPTSQYEQVNLVWYYDDSNMVKIGLELVDGEVCMVMGREEDDKTRTIAKPPIGNEVSKLHLRLTARGKTLTGEYRVGDSEELKLAGECDLPVKGDAKISLQAYQGPKDAEHWARFTNLTIITLD